MSGGVLGADRANVYDIVVVGYLSEKMIYYTFSMNSTRQAGGR